MAGKKPEDIELVSALGFAGNVSQSLLAHPNGEDIIYPLGSTIVVKNVNSGKQWFLHGHTDKVTCISLSRDGKTLASGQKTHIGFKAKVLMWDFDMVKEDTCRALRRELPEFHQVKVQAVSFSPSGKFIATLGGTDCNLLAVWRVDTGTQIGYCPASTESALTVQFLNNDDTKLLTAGYHHLRRWVIDFETDKLDHVEANLGSLRRVIKCVAVSDCDRYAYVGTSTGDVFKIGLEPATPNFLKAGNELFRKGIRAISYVRTRSKPLVLLGCGDGSVVAMDAASMKKVGAGTTMGEVTSIAPVRSAYDEPVSSFFMGTNESNIYLCTNLNDLAGSIQLRASCHYNGINDIAFLDGFDSVFVTCSKNDIRVWNAKKQQELLRIQVPNVTCTSIALPKNGDLIISGWDDGKIRAFKPVSGSLQFVINDAHPEGVTAIAVTNDCRCIISGGQKGAIRFWSMDTRKMIASLKEHKGAVTSIAVQSDDEQCVSSSDDGSCIQWDIVSHRRNQAMFASTMFKAAIYHPDESQILTCGSDRKLTYWDAFDGTAIRILEGSNHQINALDVDKEGIYFVSGGNGCQLRMFSYDDGELTAIGDGHSGAINGVKISPDQRQMVSVGSEGGIFVWKYPEPMLGQPGFRDEESKYK